MSYVKSGVAFCLLISACPAFTKTTVLDKDQVIAARNWTGYYAGVNAGVVRQTMDITDSSAVTFYATIRQVTDFNATGGVQAGYRYQLNPGQSSAVFGLEISTHFSDAQSRETYGSSFALYELDSDHKLSNVTLLELIGGIAIDKTFLFMAAGLGWSHVSGDVVNIDSAPFFDKFSVSKKQAAPAIGGGLEYAINDKFSVRFKVDVLLPQSYTTLDNADNRYNITNHIVQGTFGVNYRFGE